MHHFEDKAVSDEFTFLGISRDGNIALVQLSSNFLAMILVFDELLFEFASQLVLTDLGQPLKS